MNKLTYIIIVTLTLATFVFVTCKKDIEIQSDIDQQIMENYLTSNPNTQYTKHSNGFYYNVIEKGTGSALKSDTTIILTYTITDLENNTKYSDITLETANQVQFYFGRYGKIFPYLTQINKTFKAALANVNEGGKISLIIPSHLAYGRNGNLEVPSNRVLKAELSVYRYVDQETLEDDIIKNYIASNKLTGMKKGAEGYYYKVHEVGTGTRTIDAYSEIETGYVLKDMLGTTTTDVSKSSPTTFSVATLRQGVKLSLYKIKAGGKVECIIPSKLAYKNRKALHYVFEVVTVKND